LQEFGITDRRVPTRAASVMEGIETDPTTGPRFLFPEFLELIGVRPLWEFSVLVLRYLQLCALQFSTSSCFCTQRIADKMHQQVDTAHGSPDLPLSEKIRLLFQRAWPAPAAGVGSGSGSGSLAGSGGLDSKSSTPSSRTRTLQPSAPTQPKAASTVRRPQPPAAPRPKTAAARSASTGGAGGGSSPKAAHSRLATHAVVPHTVGLVRFADPVRPMA
jgi:hypothetical protein